MSEIDDEIYLDRPFDIGVYMKDIPTEKCTGCGCMLIKVKENTIRIWKKMHYCDICWGNFENEREGLWNVICKKYNRCNICGIEKQGSKHRFHFDHKNMFCKNESICTMINEGWDLEIINKELDDCEYICLSCHLVVTDIENKFPFTKVKKSLTYKLNRQEISQQEYDQQCIKWGNIYKKQMNNIYETLKQHNITTISI
jgi:hypothetical protein